MIGQVSTVYAALVVLLGYANVFRRTAEWQDEARYELPPGTWSGSSSSGRTPASSSSCS